MLLNLDDLKLPTGLDNIEGLAFGEIADGRQSIVLVSDNNFSSTQFTQILALGADLVPTVIPTVETRPDLIDDSTLPFSERADADDPAIYVNSTDSQKSLVLGSVKNGGLRVYDLSGNLLQQINPGNIRYNNVDLQYGFKLGGQSVDIAVASDRNNDKLAIFQIDPNGTSGQYLKDITDSSIGTLFEAAPFAPPYSPSTRSAYGLANNTIYAGEGNNTITSSGIDTIYTGSGKDTFKLDQGTGEATIYGFGASDTISLGSGFKFNDITISQLGFLALRDLQKLNSPFVEWAEKARSKHEVFAWMPTPQEMSGDFFIWKSLMKRTAKIQRTQRKNYVVFLFTTEAQRAQRRE